MSTSLVSIMKEGAREYGGRTEGRKEEGGIQGRKINKGRKEGMLTSLVSRDEGRCERGNIKTKGEKEKSGKEGIKEEA